ncbi:hypothetical protein PUP68_21685 [Pseudomonas chlororaphis]|uniref:hypothetical protein n=1 Tax=Pseudomonas chlororaphis TaxID=587753 RepID=UPI0023675147|nr:hypothetical protein [Pseudomonas chlororaphis]WDG77312.1 hypothetical protein PUP77_23175 [Pseudomonas chlororaphis]WDG83449.1 hypothetical protein PUP68_21685 [Pseudomonas chlororaphis]
MNIELRALLERVTGNSHQDSLRAIGELRALLAAPAESCGACNGCTNGCRLERESPTAAQPLPPAMIDREGGHCVEHSRNHSDGCLDCALDHATRLQAEVAEAEQRGFIRGINAEAAARRENDAAQSQGVQVNQVRSHGSDCWEDISGESLELVREQPEEYEVRTLYRHPPAPQGEPVAWFDPDALGCVRWKPGLTIKPNTPMYIGPPAPVAVVDEDWRMNPCKQGHLDVGAAGGVASCYQCDEKITAATTQEAFRLWNAAHPKP